MNTTAGMNGSKDFVSGKVTLPARPVPPKTPKLKETANV